MIGIMANRSLYYGKDSGCTSSDNAWSVVEADKKWRTADVAAEKDGEILNVLGYRSFGSLIEGLVRNSIQKTLHSRSGPRR